MTRLTLLLMVACFSSCSSAQKPVYTIDNARAEIAALKASKASLDSVRKLTADLTYTYRLAVSYRDSLKALRAQLALKEDKVKWTYLDYTFSATGDTMSVSGFRRLTQVQRVALKNVRPGFAVYQTDATRGIWFMKEEGWTFLK